MRRWLAALVALCWLADVHLEEVPPSLLLTAAQESSPEWLPLSANASSDLEVELTRRLNAKPEWRRLIQRGKLAVALVDLGSGTPRFARVNGDLMMYAASLPKIAVLLAAYASFEDGSLEETPEVHKDLKDMIQVSSNAAATRMIDAVGMQKIEQVMRDPRFGFYDEVRGGGLWVGKRYAASGVRLGDPLYDISHGATVTQVARFYYMLAAKELVNAHRSEQMLEDLANPGLHHKFVAELEQRAPTAKLFRKSGSWRNWHADSVLVQGSDWRNYILVALAESPNGETIMRELVPAVESVLRPRVLVARN